MVSKAQTPADLPFIITPARSFDERGWFSETYHEARLAADGITFRFVQENRSWSKRAGTVRGLHFQRPPRHQAKLITVLRGRIFDVAVDLRTGSPTYGRFISVELSADDGHQFYIPVGFAHGFCSLEDGSEVSYKVSDYYSPQDEGGVRWDDPDIAIPWPVGRSAMTMSPKDESLPLLRALESPFSYEGRPLDALTRDGLQPQGKRA